MFVDFPPILVCWAKILQGVFCPPKRGFFYRNFGMWKTLFWRVRPPPGICGPPSPGKFPLKKHPRCSPPKFAPFKTVSHFPSGNAPWAQNPHLGRVFFHRIFKLPRVFGWPIGSKPKIDGLLAQLLGCGLDGWVYVGHVSLQLILWCMIYCGLWDWPANLVFYQ